MIATVWHQRKARTMQRRTLTWNKRESNIQNSTLFHLHKQYTVFNTLIQKKLDKEVSYREIINVREQHLTDLCYFLYVTTYRNKQTNKESSWKKRWYYCLLPGDIWVWLCMVRWNRQGKTVWSTRVVWQSYQLSHLSAKGEELANKMMNLALRNFFVHTAKEFLTCCKI
jgi:hypothetical protein